MRIRQRTRHVPRPVTPQNARKRQTACSRILMRPLEKRLLERLDALAQAFEDAFAHNTFKEVHITKLHDELQQYKSGLLNTVQRPYITALIQMHDALGRSIEHLGTTPERVYSTAEAAQLLQDFRDDVELALEHNAIEPFHEPGDVFVPTRQTSLKTRPTDQAHHAGQVAARLRPGFEQQGCVVQKERVIVYTHHAPTNNPE